MIALSPGGRVYLACGVTDMRKGAVGLAMLVQQSLAKNPFDGSVYAFRGRRSGLIKLIWHDGIGLCMLTRRLEQGQFHWPSASTTGRFSLTSALTLPPEQWTPHGKLPRGAGDEDPAIIFGGVQTGGGVTADIEWSTTDAGGETVGYSTLDAASLARWPASKRHCDENCQKRLFGWHVGGAC